MLKSGKTPLIRAKKLEKMFGVGEIYLKLEGQNPSGHKLGRIAEVLVKDALAHNHNQIIVNGSSSYITSLLYYAQQEDMKVIIPVFKNEKWKTNRFDEQYTMDLRYIKYESKSNVLIDLAEENNAYLAAEGYTNTHISQMVLEQLTDEILLKRDFDVDSIYTYLGYGYTVTSIYNSLLKQWLKGNVKKFPTVICGTSEFGNRINDYYVSHNKIKSAEIESETSTSPHDQHLMHDKYLLEESLKAVAETDGDIISIGESALKSACKLLRSAEHIKISHTEAYSIAAFIKSVEDGKVKNGKHVIILNEGKSIVDIQEIKSFEDISKEELVNLTKKCLVQYGDSLLETQEAIENANEKGFILVASRGGVQEGICIIVHLGFDVFIPKYHLAYIGTMSSGKGRGVGSDLIKRAIDLSDGSISLHVDLENKSAKKLYEKYGFKHVYNRMIYYGDE